MRLPWKPKAPAIVCQQWVEMVTDYLEGTLPAPLQQAADRHLGECPQDAAPEPEPAEFNADQL